MEREGRTATGVAPGSGPTLARFDQPRTPRPTTLAVVADPHLSTRKVGTWKLFHRTESRLATVVADCNARDLDGVVVAGDLTENGRPADLDRVHDLLGRLRAPVFAVPGNHDVPKASDRHETPSVDEFERRFTPGGLPFRASVGGVDVLGLNTATDGGRLRDSHEGAVSPAGLEWLAEAVVDAETPLVVGHHTLSTADDLGASVGDWRSSVPLRDADALLETLGGTGALYLSAHLHVPAVGQPEGDVCELVVPPLCSFPQGYVLLRVGPAGTTARYVPVGDADDASEAYLAARRDKSKSEALAAVAVEQFQRLPLHERSAESGRRDPPDAGALVGR